MIDKNGVEIKVGDYVEFYSRRPEIDYLLCGKIVHLFNGSAKNSIILDIRLISSNNDSFRRSGTAQRLPKEVKKLSDEEALIYIMEQGNDQ